jgi:hypothetical protein
MGSLLDWEDENESIEETTMTTTLPRSSSFYVLGVFFISLNGMSRHKRYVSYYGVSTHKLFVRFKNWKSKIKIPWLFITTAGVYLYRPQTSYMGCIYTST